MGVAAVMRVVTFWAFTVPFNADLRDFEAEMAATDQPVDAYLAQFSSIRAHRRVQSPDVRARRRGGHPHPRATLPEAARVHPWCDVGDHEARPRLPGGRRATSTHRCWTS